MNESKRNVLIIHTDGNSFNNPSVKCIIDLLIENGWNIDLRYPKSHAPMPKYEGVRLLPFGAILRSWKTVVYDLFCARSLVLLSVAAENLIHYKKYDLIIGIDRRGLIEANVIHKINGTQFVFISFEIMFENETSVRYKALEREASRDVAAWFVQDELRAGLLQSENDLDPKKKILLPIASAGIGRLGASRLRDVLGVPYEKNVAILIGSVSDWSMARQILESTADWPEDWVLIVHDRYGRTGRILAGEIDGLGDLIGRKIFISDAATEMVDDMGNVLSGVSAGLAFYKPDFKGPYTGRNLKYLGLSAGKISTYLRYGIPVILNEIGLYSSEAREHGFGYVVECPEQIRERLNDCLDARVKHNASAFFTEKLDFNVHRGRVWERLSSVGR